MDQDNVVVGWKPIEGAGDTSHTLPVHELDVILQDSVGGKFKVPPDVLEAKASHFGHRGVMEAAITGQSNQLQLKVILA